MHKNIAIIGSYENLDLGKLSGRTDIEYHSKIYMGDIYSIFLPYSYPEKIQSLLVSLNLADFVIFRVEKIDWSFGEALIAVDLLNKEGLFFADEWMIDEIKKYTRGTSLYKWEFVSSEIELWKYLLQWKPKERDELEVWIDQAFKVRGVGTVVLGVIKAGCVKTHDVLKIFPAEKEVEIKSIQIQDENKEKACSNARVGLALKNIEPEEIPRGSIIGDTENITEIKHWKKIEFYKGDEKKVTHVFHGISFVPYQNGNVLRALPVSRVSKRFLVVENTSREKLRIAGYDDIII